MPEQTADSGTWVDKMFGALADEPTTPTPDTPDPASPPPEPPVPTDAAPATETPPPSPDSAAPETPASPEAPASTDPPAAVPPAAPVPFTFRVDGRDVSPKGAVVQPDGTIAFTPESFRTFQQQFVADRGVWRQKEQQYQRQIEQTAQQQTAAQVQAEAILTAITKAAEQGDQAIYDLATGFAQNLPKLKAEAEARFYREQLERQEKAAAPQQAAQQWESWQAAREEALDLAVQWAEQQDDYKAIAGQTGAFRKQLSELSESGKLWKLNEQGQPVIDEQVFKWFIGLHAEAAKAKAEAKAAAEIAKRNQASLTPKVNAPPMPGASAPAPAAVPATAAGLTAKERWARFREAEDL